MLVSVHNGSAAAELAEFRKITTFSEKKTIFNENPVQKDVMILSPKNASSALNE